MTHSYFHLFPWCLSPILALSLSLSIHLSISLFVCFFYFYFPLMHAHEYKCCAIRGDNDCYCRKTGGVSFLHMATLGECIKVECGSCYYDCLPPKAQLWKYIWTREYTVFWPRYNDKACATWNLLFFVLTYAVCNISQFTVCSVRQRDLHASCYGNSLHMRNVKKKVRDQSKWLGCGRVFSNALVLGLWRLIVVLGDESDPAGYWAGNWCAHILSLVM